MKLSEFPRPPEDNGRGIHWSASVYHPDGDALKWWINELVEMNIKWVKVLDDGGGSSIKVCEALLANGIMPVVRLYRHRPNPGHIGGRERETVRRLVAMGVRYFESNNEPDLPVEWQAGRRPPNWLEIVVDNFIIDADIILGEGGLPAIPAMAIGASVNPYAMIAEKRPDLFESGIWAAIHNYTLNHPLDYPDDPVNQEGKPLTREEYERLGPWAWDGDRLEDINRWRASDKNPGATILDDTSCWRAFEAVNHMIVEACGHSIPIITTEGGPVVGWRNDRRYPRITPELHRDMVVEINDYMQRKAPPYYFACCHWLIANFKIGHLDPTWESQAWYTDSWNERFGLHGRLPTVDAVKAMPNVIRVGAGKSSISGFLRDEEGRYLTGVTVTLYKDGQQIGITTSDVTGLFRFAHLVEGRYDIGIEGLGIVLQGIELGPQEDKFVDLAPLEIGERSTLEGRVTDEDGNVKPNLEVILLRDESPVARTSTDDQGRYSFSGLKEGFYGLKTGPFTMAYVALDGWSKKRFDVILPSPPGYRYKVITKRLLPPEETLNRRLFYGQVMDEKGVPMSGIKVMMTWTGAPPGTQFPVKVTGSDPTKPPGYYEFTHTPGTFQLHVVQGDWDSETADGLETAHVPGREPGAPVTYEVNFQLLPVGTSPGATVRGELPGLPPGRNVILQAEGSRQVVRLDDESCFKFEGLQPGEYALALEGLGTVAQGIRVGQGEIFHLRMPFQGILEGKILGAAEGARVKLVSIAFGWTLETRAGAQGQYRFEGVPRGRYYLALQDKTIGEAESDGVSSIVLPDFQIEERFGTLQGRITDALDKPVEGLHVIVLKGGNPFDDAVTDAQGSYRFPNLSPGIYDLKVEGFGVLKTGVEVKADEVTEVNLSLPPEKPRKPLRRCLFFGSLDNPIARVNFLLAQDYILKFGIASAFSVKDASQADRVIIVGDERVVTGEQERLLKEAGCEVRRITGDSYAIASALAEEM